MYIKEAPYPFRLLLALAFLGLVALLVWSFGGDFLTAIRCYDNVACQLFDVPVKSTLHLAIEAVIGVFFIVVYWRLFRWYISPFVTLPDGKVYFCWSQDRIYRVR